MAKLQPHSLSKRQCSELNPLRGVLCLEEPTSPGCDLTHFTLDVDNFLLCIWAPLTSNREKQAHPHSPHPPDTHLRRSDDRHFSPATIRGTSEMPCRVRPMLSLAQFLILVYLGRECKPFGTGKGASVWAKNKIFRFVMQ